MQNGISLVRCHFLFCNGGGKALVSFEWSSDFASSSLLGCFETASIVVKFKACSGVELMMLNVAR